MAPLSPQMPAPQVDGWQIVSGPSREVLFDALRLIHEGRELKFELIRPDDVREEIALKILSIEAIGDYNAPGGGQMWLVKTFDPSVDVDTHDRICLLSYSTQSRTGTLRHCSADMAGPSYLPADERMREGFFLPVAKHGILQLCIGPFETGEERKQFLRRLMDEMKEEGFGSRGRDGDDFYAGVEGEPWTFTVKVCNVIPEWIGLLPPEHYTGLEMFDAFSPPEEEEDGPMFDGSDM